MDAETRESHFNVVTRAIGEGRVVPFLGAGAAVFARPPEAGFRPGQYLPSGSELMEYLADGYPKNEPKDLLRVAQFVYIVEGSGPLYERLHRVFDANYPVTELHDLLASIPRRLAQLGQSAPHLLVMTTNYDDLLERAFAAAGEPYDVVWYVADGESRGKFRHRSPDGTTRIIVTPNEYTGLSLQERSVILKIHGAVDRSNPEEDSYVIAEDHYIDYLTRTDIASLIPVTLAAKIRKSHLLFLGYSLADWNMRVILQRIWGAQQLTYRSWAVQRGVRELDVTFWRNRGVEILETDLDQYVRELRARLDALKPAGAATT